MRSPAVAALVFVSAFAVVVTQTAGCAFGATLPRGAGGGVFVDAPRAQPPLSASLSRERDALDAAAAAEARARVVVLRRLLSSATALRRELRERKSSALAEYQKTGKVSSLDVERVRASARWFVELDAVLYAMWVDYRDFLPYGSEPDPFAPANAASLYGQETRDLGGLVALAAELVRLDNAAAAVDLLEPHAALAHLLNRGDAERGIPPETWDRTLGALRNPDHRAMLARHVDGVRRAGDRLADRSRTDADVAFLLAVVGDSRVAGVVREESNGGRQAVYAWTVLERSALSLLSPAFDLYLSTLYLESDGLDVESLPRLSAAAPVDDAVRDALLPLDVVLCQDARRGVDAGYTHAYLHTGDLADVRALLNDHPALAAHAGALRRGHVLLDLDRQGARLVTVDDAMLGQEIAIVRLGSPALPPEADAGPRADRLRRALDALLLPPPTAVPGAALSGQLVARAYALDVGRVRDDDGALLSAAVRALLDDGAVVVLATDGGALAADATAALQKRLPRAARARPVSPASPASPDAATEAAAPTTSYADEAAAPPAPPTP